MKKYLSLIAASLCLCLFIYVFYRTEKTLVNQALIICFSEDRYTGLKTMINAILPLKGYLVYSLPEGLWVFCITLTSSFFYVEIFKRKCSLVFVPVVVALGMELFQLMHISNGRFDMMDISFACGFWVLALFWTRKHSASEPLFQSLDTKSICCILSYSIVYLAHVSH